MPRMTYHSVLLPFLHPHDTFSGVVRFDCCFFPQRNPKTKFRWLVALRSTRDMRDATPPIKILNPTLRRIVHVVHPSFIQVYQQYSRPVDRVSRALSSLSSSTFGASGRGSEAYRSRACPSYSYSTPSRLLYVQVGMEFWSVLGLSLAIDGYVLVKTVQGIWASKPKDMAFSRHMKNASTINSSL